MRLPKAANGRVDIIVIIETDKRNTVQSVYKVVQIQGMSAYSVPSPGPDSYLCIGIGESRLYIFFSGYRSGPEPFHISGLQCTTVLSNTGKRT